MLAAVAEKVTRRPAQMVVPAFEVMETEVVRAGLTKTVNVLLDTTDGVAQAALLVNIQYIVLPFNNEDAV